MEPDLVDYLRELRELNDFFRSNGDNVTTTPYPKPRGNPDLIQAPSLVVSTSQNTLPVPLESTENITVNAPVPLAVRRGQKMLPPLKSNSSVTTTQGLPTPTSGICSEASLVQDMKVNPAFEPGLEGITEHFGSRCKLTDQAALEVDSKYLFRSGTSGKAAHGTGIFEKAVRRKRPCNSGLCSDAKQPFGALATSTPSPTPSRTISASPGLSHYGESSYNNLNCDQGFSGNESPASIKDTLRTPPPLPLPPVPVLCSISSKELRGILKGSKSVRFADSPIKRQTIPCTTTITPPRLETLVSTYASTVSPSQTIFRPSPLRISTTFNRDSSYILSNQHTPTSLNYSHPPRAYDLKSAPTFRTRPFRDSQPSPTIASGRPIVTALNPSKPQQQQTSQDHPHKGNAPSVMPHSNIKTVHTRRAPVLGTSINVNSNIKRPVSTPLSTSKLVYAYQTPTPPFGGRRALNIANATTKENPKKQHHQTLSASSTATSPSPLRSQAVARRVTVPSQTPRIENISACPRQKKRHQHQASGFLITRASGFEMGEPETARGSTGSGRVALVAQRRSGNQTSDVRANEPPQYSGIKEANDPGTNKSRMPIPLRNILTKFR